MLGPMGRIRLFTLAFAIAAVLLSFGATAQATEPFPTAGVVSLSSGHFRVLYNRDSSSAAYLTQEQAGDVLGMAERAYALYQSWGYATPVLDQLDMDGQIEISVDSFTGAVVSLPDFPAGVVATYPRWTFYVHTRGGLEPPGADDIHLDNVNGIDFHTIAHAVFHLFEDAYVGGPGVGVATDTWFHEATAEWAAYRADNFVGVGQDKVGQDGRSGDCVGAECGKTEYDRAAYPGWAFIEQVNERYGADTVESFWEHANTVVPAGQTTPQLLGDVLSGEGTTFAQFFNDYTTALLNGNFTLTALTGKPPVTAASIQVGTAGGAIPTAAVGVNHLSARYVMLVPGDVADPTKISGQCYAASLALKVTATPSAFNSTPYVFVDSAGNAPQALSVSGSTASITLPWSTCAAGSKAYLSLPNGALSLAAATDGQEFTVSGTLTIDTKTVIAPGARPDPVKMPETAVSVPTSDVAPTIQVFGPEVIHLAASDRELRLIVSSDSPGKVQAAIGSTILGTPALRAGSNDLRFPVPASIVSSLRRQSAADNILSLTPIASTGVTGTAVQRVLALDGKPTVKPKKGAPKKKHAVSKKKAPKKKTSAKR